MMDLETSMRGSGISAESEPSAGSASPAQFVAKILGSQNFGQLSSNSVSNSIGFGCLPLNALAVLA